MSKQLRLGVVAECVEHPEQLHLLEQWGCDTVQGHVFSTAVPAKDVVALFRDGAPRAPNGALRSDPDHRTSAKS